MRVFFIGLHVEVPVHDFWVFRAGLRALLWATLLWGIAVSQLSIYMQILGNRAFLLSDEVIQQHLTLGRWNLAWHLYSLRRLRSVAGTAAFGVILPTTTAVSVIARSAFVLGFHARCRWLALLPEALLRGLPSKGTSLRQTFCARLALLHGRFIVWCLGLVLWWIHENIVQQLRVGGCALADVALDVLDLIFKVIQFFLQLFIFLELSGLISCFFPFCLACCGLLLLLLGRYEIWLPQWLGLAGDHFPLWS